MSYLTAVPLPFEPRPVAVLGLGYVGSVTAACLARLGHRVRGVDTDPTKVEALKAGRAPFFEPGLEEIIRGQSAAGQLTAGTLAAEAVAESDVVIVCVGTPSCPNGKMSTEHLDRVFAELYRCAEGRTKPLVIAVRSTVFPGTLEERAAPLAANPNIAVVANPEFLREGSAVADFLDPALVVVGGEQRWAVETVASLYAPLGVEPSLLPLRAAEMVKYACNAFHALKITFANEIGTLAQGLGISPHEILDVVCSDTRLNISRAYLRPGFAFGGSCLAKDLRALTYRALRLDLKLPLLESVLPANQQHLDRGVQQVLSLDAQRIGVFGLAFKENTDDLRESAVVAAIEQWIGKGKDIRVHDPHIQLDAIYGSNRNFIFRVLPHIGRLMTPALDELLEWAECIVIAQTPPAAARACIEAAGKPVIDLAGMK